MWIVKAQVIPAITGAAGTVSKSLKQYLSNTPGEHEINALHNTAVLRTAHILWKVLMWKYRTYFTGEITLSVEQFVYTEQLQQYHVP